MADPNTVIGTLDDKNLLHLLFRGITEGGFQAMCKTTNSFPKQNFASKTKSFCRPPSSQRLSVRLVNPCPSPACCLGDLRQPPACDSLTATLKARLLARLPGIYTMSPCPLPYDVIAAELQRQCYASRVIARDRRTMRRTAPGLMVNSS